MTKRKICFITGSRADFGILSGLIKSLNSDLSVVVQIIATNMHLSPEFGSTINEIENEGIKVDKKIEMLLSSDSHVGTVKSMGLATIGFADAYNELRPDIVVVLGDRYEILAAACAANIFNIPIAHLHGGEITEGAYDDSIRHAITKLSYLHFTATPEYRNRVIQMGECPERVFWTGSISLDRIQEESILEYEDLKQNLGFELGSKFLLLTYHPVTREPGEAEMQITNLLKALENLQEKYKFLFTLPNSDTEGRIIIDLIRKWCDNNKDKAIAVPSLGKKRYFSALSHCIAIIGNSSSGIIEAPYFRKPTLNIGNRQKGRTIGNTIVNCDVDYNSIFEGLKKVISHDFIDFVKTKGTNPYFKENAIYNIHNILVNTSLSLNPTKKFYDIKQ